MTEQEYIDATNRGKIKSATVILRSLDANDFDNIDRQDLKDAIFNLDRVASSVSDRIKIES